MEALSCDFRTGCPFELLYADDLAIISDSMDNLLEKLCCWKSGLEAKGLRVNMAKTKLMISGINLGLLKGAGKHPCGVCRKGVGANSIFCSSCEHWVHKKCTSIKGRLTPNPNFKCCRCLGTARPIDSRPANHVLVDDHKLEVVGSFCYLGDSVSAGGGCEAATVTRIRTAWGKFRELLPILTTKSLSLRTRGSIYNLCIRGAMLYASECWALKKSDMDHLNRNKHSMVRWMLGVKSDDRTSTTTLIQRLSIPHLGLAITCRRLRWFGHIKCGNAWTARVSTLDIEGQTPRGWLRKTWAEVIHSDLREFNLDPAAALDRWKWKAILKDIAAMQRHTCH